MQVTLSHDAVMGRGPWVACANDMDAIRALVVRSNSTEEHQVTNHEGNTVGWVHATKGWRFE